LWCEADAVAVIIQQVDRRLFSAVAVLTKMSPLLMIASNTQNSRA
jgi:hypothetical protein